MDLFKPLLSWRKYLMASRLLKIAANTHITAAAINDFATHQKAYVPIRFVDFLNTYPNTVAERYLEAVNLLEENKHVIKNDNQDLYKVTVRCTDKGESANNDGFYMTKVYNHVYVVGGIAIAIIAGLIKWILVLADKK